MIARTATSGVAEAMQMPPVAGFDIMFIKMSVFLKVLSNKVSKNFHSSGALMYFGVAIRVLVC